MTPRAPSDSESGTTGRSLTTESLTPLPWTAAGSRPPPRLSFEREVRRVEKEDLADLGIQRDRRRRKKPQTLIGLRHREL